MKDRLFTFIEYTQLSATEFADNIGISRAAISSIKTGRTQLTLSIVYKIKTHYPILNTDWLLFGSGIMINSNSINTVIGNEDTKLDNIKGLSDKEDLFDGYPIEKINIDTGLSSYHSKFLENNNNHTEQNNTVSTPYVANNDSINRKKLIQKKIVKIIICYDDSTFEEYIK